MILMAEAELLAAEAELNFLVVEAGSTAGAVVATMNFLAVEAEKMVVEAAVKTNLMAVGETQAAEAGLMIPASVLYAVLDPKMLAGVRLAEDILMQAAAR
jgi:hypothetical protein